MLVSTSYLEAAVGQCSYLCSTHVQESQHLLQLFPISKVQLTQILSLDYFNIQMVLIV